jgi:hypothetical protein
MKTLKKEKKKEYNILVNMHKTKKPKKWEKESI